jgi:hypothetical protein
MRQELHAWPATASLLLFFKLEYSYPGSPVFDAGCCSVCLWEEETGTGRTEPAALAALQLKGCWSGRPAGQQRGARIKASSVPSKEHQRLPHRIAERRSNPTTTMAMVPIQFRGQHHIHFTVVHTRTTPYQHRRKCLSKKKKSTEGNGSVAGHCTGRDQSTAWLSQFETGTAAEQIEAQDNVVTLHYKLSHILRRTDRIV